jgi:plasmid stabilization system protein ParE
LNRIWQYIAAGNLDAANDVVSAIYYAFDLLSKMPNAAIGAET